MSVDTSVRLELARPPVTADELWWLVYAMFDVRIPRTKVCPDHDAPFDAFCDAYFGNEWNWALWYGSRGTGKSYLLAILALLKSSVLEVQVTLLGGSMAQSTNVQEHVSSLMHAPNAPRHVVTSEKQTELGFTFAHNGGADAWIRPLPASQKTVRGPHPHMTLLDEIDEMDRKVYDAAMGQAMEKPNARGVVVPEMVVASSTWQNPVGTFSEVLVEARTEGKPIFTWCYKEVLAPTGWMEPDFIERKRSSVPAEMFRVEYDLGEPAGDARAFDLAKVAAYFEPLEKYGEPLEHRKAGGDELYVFEKPVLTHSYAVGADWAKERDFTVITVVRTDQNPRRLVYWRKVNRRPWPVMIGYFDDVVRDYHAQSAHDATGLGNVVHDLVKSERTLKVEMIGKDRTKLLSEYIVDFEAGAYRFPRIPAMYEAHRSTTVDEVWGTARWDSHLPDEVASAAIMHRAAERAPMPAPPAGVGKSDFIPKSHSPLHAGPRVEGLVEIKDPEEGVFIPVPERSGTETYVEVGQGAFRL